MKLIFIGSGSAFTLGDNNYQSNMILELPSGQKLLIDCGTDARLALHEQHLGYQDISAVYISHLHADHVGGLEWLAFTTKFDPACTKKPILYTSEDLVDDLWNKVLCGGLSSIEGVQACLETYFEVITFSRDQPFKWNELTIQPVPTIHFASGFEIMPSYGLFFEANGKKVLISTDTQFGSQHLHEMYEQADIIFHDCETLELRSGIHAHYNELIDLKPAIKRKMWLYHYNPNNPFDALKDGFLGFVKKGQSFSF